MDDTIQSFIEFMSSHGCAPDRPSDIVATGEDVYFRLAGDKKDKRGGYCLTIEPDGFAHGNFISFKTGEKGSWHSRKGIKNLSAEERGEIKARIEASEKAREAARKEAQDKAAINARTAWEAFPQATEHPYLTKKAVKPYNARIDGEDLIIPMYATDGKLYAYQRIRQDGGKWYLPGARKNGLFCALAENTPVKDYVILCEGFATGATIREALPDIPVIICFDAYNLGYVAQAIRTKYKTATIIMAADNDDGEVNTGIKKAEQAAVKVGGKVIWPEKAGTDFNDIGIDATRERISGVLSVTAPETLPEGNVRHPSLSTLQPSGSDYIPPTEEDLDLNLVPINAQIDSGSITPAFDDKKINNSLLWKKWPSDMDKGKLEPNCLENILIFLRHKQKYQKIFRYDRFAGRIIVHKQPFWQTTMGFKVRELQDSDIGYMTASMERDGLAPSGAKVHEAINMTARENWIDPPLDYFNQLVWDKVPRLETWLVKYLGANGEKDYLAAVGSAFCIALVARQFNPGCKAENMLVLEGPQGLLKSTALKALADVGCGEDQESYFCDTLSFDQLKDKDSVLKMQGKTIIEIPDLAGLSGGEIEEVKQRMSIMVDEIRVPYGREMVKFPRRFVWAGSTNESHWLKDQTGNRRFWPVECTNIDIKSLIRDREQIIAEAVYKYKNKAQWWIGRNNPIWSKVEAEQRSRLLEDIWFSPVERFIEGLNFITIGEILTHLKIEVKDQKSFQQKQVIGILKQLGFKSINKRHNGRMTRGWERISAVQDIVEPEFEEIAF